MVFLAMSYACFNLTELRRVPLQHLDKLLLLGDAVAVDSWRLAWTSRVVYRHKVWVFFAESHLEQLCQVVVGLHQRLSEKRHT